MKSDEETGTRTPVSGHTATDQDEAELARMGYKQELKYAAFSLTPLRLLTLTF